MNDEDMLPIDAINEFYRLKDNYEYEYYKKYIKPIIKSKNSRREKRINFSKLPKNECINCKRNVGTIFSLTVDRKENIRKYIAKCGDINSPCPLDIEILYGVREPMDMSIRDGMKTIEEIKLNIIKEKNNAIFFNKDVIKSFENITEELKTETENIGFMIETNILRNNNPEKYALLKKTMNDFGTFFIIPFKQMINRYKETNDTSVLKVAVTFYINDMIPKLKEIQLLKYDVNIVEYNLATDIYQLIQLPNSLENKEFFLKSDDKVIKIIRGIKNAKTKKALNLISKFKTKKNRRIEPESYFSNNSPDYPPPASSSASPAYAPSSNNSPDYSPPASNNSPDYAPPS